MPLLLATLACRAPPVDTSGVQVHMDFGRADFYAAPFPSDELLVDGAPDLSAFPDPLGYPFVGAVLAMIGTRDGFGTTSAVYFTLDDAPGPLPTLAESLAADAPLFLQDVDPASPRFGERFPVTASFVPDGGPYGAPNLLALLPLQGLPLSPGTRYAAVVRRTLGDSDGAPLGVSPSMAALAAGSAPPNVERVTAERYLDAIEGLAATGVPASELAGLAVFSTGHPRSRLESLVTHGLKSPMPSPDAPLTLTDVFDDYCVYASTVRIPVYQAGVPPYLTEGGGIVFDADGVPIQQAEEVANLVVTIPRGAQPDTGWPTVVMIPTGGGGDRPLVDRGVHAEPHGEAIEPGTGPALWFARSGYAGMSVDGPHVGRRNITNGDTQFLMFNLTNPEAMLDNFTQSAFEVALQARLAPTLAVDLGECDGASAPSGVATLDGGALALFGHSMGATIAVPAAAVAPEYHATILSGAGGSWLENVLYKLSPLEVRPVAEAMIGYGETGDSLTATDPLLSLVQWVGEGTDPPVFADALSAPDRHVLMFQGIVDTYILPPIANPLSLALGADLAGPVLDDDPALAAYESLTALLPYSGRGSIALPATANHAGSTVVVVQHAEDGVEDGHEVVFQLQAPKDQYACFLATLPGAPTVPAAGGACP